MWTVLSDLNIVMEPQHSERGRSWQKWKYSFKLAMPEIKCRETTHKIRSTDVIWPQFPTKNVAVMVKNKKE